MDGDTTFGAWLKRRRRQLDLTQKGLAHQAGCSVGTIRKMEADERRPSRQLAGLLAQHLEIPVDQLKPFITFARSEPYLSEVSFPILTPDEEPIPTVSPEASARLVEHNLPLGITPFVGREGELIALDDLLLHPEVRLVTIVGPGGIGKTRLGIACAERQLENQDGSEIHPYKDGIFFVNLTPLPDAERLIPTLAEALDFRMQGGAREKRSPKQQLVDYLRNKGLLLVLDNFEHLLSPPKHPKKEDVTDAAALVAEILGAAPEVCILVTSRERLNLQMEQVFAIDGLAFPDWETGAPGAGVEEIGEYEAMQLFLEAAQRNQQDFSLETPDGRMALAHICQLVEGMPLALELAASWVDTLSTMDIATELKLGLDLLESEMRDVSQRQRSVRATFDHSWRILDNREQSVFVQLSIFRGGFTRQAAQAVTGATLRQLSRLVNKSLIQFSQQRDRYQVHELLRQYGYERLSRESKLVTALQDRHSSYYCQFLAYYTDDLKGPGQAQAISAIEADFENVRLAWNHALTHQDLSAISISLESLFRFFLNRAWWLQGVNEFEKAEDALRTDELIGKKGVVLGQLLAWLSWLYSWTGQPGKTSETLDESLDLLRRYGTREQTLLPLIFLADDQESPEESCRLFEECLPLAREVGDQWAIAHVLSRMGIKFQKIGAYEQAEQSLREGLQQISHNNDRIGIADFLGRLSIVVGECGRYQEALSLARESMSISQEFTVPLMCLDALGLALTDLGRYDEAEEPIKQGLTIVRDLGLRAIIPEWQYYLGRIAFLKGDYGHATQQHQDSLAGALEFEDLEVVVLNHDALGRVNLALADYLQAREHLKSALQTVIPLGRPPILLATLASVAELFAEEFNLVYAALLATYVRDHPASQARVKERTERLLSRLEAELSADDLAKIRERSRQSDLDILAAQLVIDLEKQ